MSSSRARWTPWAASKPVGCEGEGVEGLEGDIRSEESLGVGEAAQAVVGGGDLGLGIALFDTAGWRGRRRRRRGRAGGS